MNAGKRTLVSGHIVGWEASAAFPLAQVRASLGQAGELGTETQVRGSPLHTLLAILMQFLPSSISARCNGGSMESCSFVDLTQVPAYCAHGVSHQG